MKIVRETTVWSTGTPNHTYILNDSMTKMTAYIPAGTRRRVTFSKPMGFDRRGRTFEVLKSIDDQESLRVEGSNGKFYNLTRADGHWRCSCPGYLYRGACRHLALAPKE